MFYIVGLSFSRLQKEVSDLSQNRPQSYRLYCLDAQTRKTFHFVFKKRKSNVCALGLHPDSDVLQLQFLQRSQEMGAQKGIRMWKTQVRTIYLPPRCPASCCTTNLDCVLQETEASHESNTPLQPHVSICLSVCLAVCLRLTPPSC